MRGRETEIKLEVRDPRALRERLKKLGFRRATPRHLEVNRLFDFSDLRLRRAGCLLRVRFEGRRCVLTYKGAPLGSGRYKVRGEIETRVENGDRVIQILESLGLHETFRYEKFRTAYARRHNGGSGRAAVLDYDETPIGTFIELEGPKRWIDGVAGQLGFGRQDYVTSSYAALYFQHCRRQGVEPGNMVFPTRK